MNEKQHGGMTRWDFGMRIGIVGAALGLSAVTTAQGAEDVPRDSQGKIIPGFEKDQRTTGSTAKGWQPVSDRRIKVGIAGTGNSTSAAAVNEQANPKVMAIKCRLNISPFLV